VRWQGVASTPFGGVRESLLQPKAPSPLRFAGALQNKKARQFPGVLCF